MSKKTERSADSERAEDAGSPPNGKPNGKTRDDTREASADEAPLEAEGEPAESQEEPPESAETAQLRDQLLRLAADFDNFRKRARREQDEARHYGVTNLLNDVLPVMDNLERALLHVEGDKSPVIQGVRLVLKQFGDILARYGVTGFSSMGEPFNPERHEAVGQRPGGDAKPGAIVEELQRGYMLHGRLLRPARVIVATPAPDAESAGIGES